MTVVTPGSVAGPCYTRGPLQPRNQRLRGIDRVRRRFFRCGSGSTIAVERALCDSARTPELPKSLVIVNAAFNGLPRVTLMKSMTRLPFASLTLATVLAAGTATGETATVNAAEPTKTVDVLIKTNHGDITLELNAQKAPNTVANFLEYVEADFYDGTIFHRVIDGFMIQGGGFTGDYQQKTTRNPVDNEADNGLTNDAGTIAMARTQDPHSATAQFFINVADNEFLNFKSPDVRGWGYAVFGRVTDGMEVVNAIKAVPVGAAGPFGQDAPQEQVIINSIDLVN